MLDMHLNHEPLLDKHGVLVFADGKKTRIMCPKCFGKYLANPREPMYYDVGRLGMKPTDAKQIQCGHCGATLVIKYRHVAVFRVEVVE
jgi:DNA-directed RNA polymerase subunit RPC12/RpoP